MSDPTTPEERDRWTAELAATDYDPHAEPFAGEERNMIQRLLADVERLGKHQCAPTGEWTDGLCPQASRLASDHLAEILEKDALIERLTKERDEARIKAHSDGCFGIEVIGRLKKERDEALAKIEWLREPQSVCDGCCRDGIVDCAFCMSCGVGL